MSDEQLPTGSEPDVREDVQDGGGTRSREDLLLVAAVVVAIVLVLLFWRSCSTSQNNVSDTGAGAGAIVAVPKLPADEQTIAIWVKAGVDVKTVLARYSLGAAGIQDMGGGTYIVTVPEGTDVPALIGRLKADANLVDAGNVYLNDQQKGLTGEVVIPSSSPSGSADADPGALSTETSPAASSIDTAEVGVSPVGQ